MVINPVRTTMAPPASFAPPCDSASGRSSHHPTGVILDAFDPEMAGATGGSTRGAFGSTGLRFDLRSE